MSRPPSSSFQLLNNGDNIVGGCREGFSPPRVGFRKWRACQSSIRRKSSAPAGKGKEQLGGWDSSRRMVGSPLLPGFCDVIPAAFLRRGRVCTYVTLSSNKIHVSWLTLNMVLNAISKWNPLQFVVWEVNGGFPGRLIRTGWPLRSKYGAGMFLTSIAP